MDVILGFVPARMGRLDGIQQFLLVSRYRILVLHLEDRGLLWRLETTVELRQCDALVDQNSHPALYF